MTLHPHAATLVATLAELGELDLAAMDLVDARAMMAATRAPVEGIATGGREDLAVPVRDGASIKARHYRPAGDEAGGDGQGSLLIYYHGGGWVFGDLEGGDVGGGDIESAGNLFTEDTPYAPSSPYSASKASSDHLVRAWQRTFKLPTLITNCSNNYGPFHFPEKLIPLVILNALDGKPLPIYGDGKQVRDWLFVDDHARALCLVATTGEIGETYNIGGFNEKENIQVVRTICELLNKKVSAKPNGILMINQKNFRNHGLRAFSSDDLDLFLFPLKKGELTSSLSFLSNEFLSSCSSWIFSYNRPVSEISMGPLLSILLFIRSLSFRSTT